MKPTVFAILLSILAGCGDPQQPSHREARKDQNTPEQKRAETQRWFQDARFGMFIHWGVYSVLEDGEWVMHNRKMTIEEYEKLPGQFNPTAYDPAEWVRLAKDAGMKYITITSKHHDGFAMWDSLSSDDDVVEQTPYGRDVLKMLADECRKQDLKLFFYHSHLDWHHLDYFPRGRTGENSGRPEAGNFEEYLDYMNTQIAELSDGRYGELAGFWFDGWWDQRDRSEEAPPTATHVNWKLQETYDLINRLQPQALIGTNHHVAPFPGETFQMFEKDLPGHNTTGFSADTEVGQLPLETCETINGSWGYNRQDNNLKSTPELIQYLVKAAGYNANFLLNVGPTPQGTIQPEFQERLRGVGKWLEKNGESIYSTRGGPMPPQQWGVMTHRKDRAFLHILDPDIPARVRLPLPSNVHLENPRFLTSGSSLEWSAQPEHELHLPPEKRDAVNTIIVFDLVQ